MPHLMHQDQQHKSRCKPKAEHLCPGKHADDERPKRQQELSAERNPLETEQEKYRGLEFQKERKQDRSDTDGSRARRNLAPCRLLCKPPLASPAVRDERSPRGDRSANYSRNVVQAAGDIVLR